jgi:DNA primase
MISGFQYLIEKRHLTEETVRAFHLGYLSPKGDLYADPKCPELVKELTKKDFRFRDTVLFPIFDMYGDVIAVSARLMVPKEGHPKYVNTIYEKASHLYGLHLAWPEILRSRKVYVVEGNVDVLQMHQHGLTNTVAMLGSNLSVKQVALLSRFADEIVLVPDGDEAGVKVLEKFRKLVPKRYSDTHLKFSYVPLPDQLDPDTYLSKCGMAELQKLERSLFRQEDKLNV